MPAALSRSLPAPRRVAAAACAALGALAAVSALPGPASASLRSGPATDLAALTKLRDFAYRSADGSGTAGIVIVGRAHSPTDFEVDAFIGASHHPARTIVVGAKTYEVLGSLTEAVPEPKDYWANSGEVTAAKAWVGLLRSFGVVLRRAGSCTVAKVAGTAYTETTPQTHGIVSIAQRACIANSGGELLAFDEEAGGTALAQVSAGHLSHLSESFTVTAVGGVAYIPAPSATPLPH